MACLAKTGECARARVSEPNSGYKSSSLDFKANVLMLYCLLASIFELIPSRHGGRI